jgi:hypothetical protein
MQGKIMPILLQTVAAILINTCVFCQQKTSLLVFDFYGDTVSFGINMPDTNSLSGLPVEKQVREYAAAFIATGNKDLVASMLEYRDQQHLDDWIYYQLVRKIAQQVSPKLANYERYTMLKWYLLTRSGYDATLKTGNGKLLFYVQANDNIFNIPVYYKNGKQYVCLNYHDYGFFDMKDQRFDEVDVAHSGPVRPFSYKVTQVPEGKNNSYVEKKLQFNYYESVNHFSIKLNPNVQQMFANYPAVDYSSYFNIPLSRQTYQTLIPELKKHLSKTKPKKGIDFLMRFTRYAFLFEPDTKNFGREKRFTPEQTLLNTSSDCEDRAALFFYLVKEIYNLPMIVLSYPKHITIAVKLKKPVGKPVLYNGEKYTVAEPTPQREDIALGKMLPELKGSAFEVVYVYNPEKKSP